MKNSLLDGGSSGTTLNHPNQVENNLPALARLRVRLVSLRLRFTPFFNDVKEFARWLEAQVLPRVDGQGKTALDLALGKKGRFSIRAIEPEHLDALKDFHQVGSFLRGIGISRIKLSTRLEQNQIQDLMIFLYTYQVSITLADRTGHGLMGMLFGRYGVSLSSMNIRISSGTLQVDYYYCLTRFSRFVVWFERRNRAFSDHRALFNSAPKYGLLASLITLVPLAIYLAHGSQLLLIMISILAALTLYALIYSFFMVIGSLEYDNEEKAYWLAKANQELRINAQKIQGDLARARTLQEIMLPDHSCMPLPGHLAWAFTYLPETEVGGDYFDAIQIDANHVAVIFADVSGHGMQAAFITAIMKSTFLTLTEDKNSLEQFMSVLNRRLVTLTPQESFAAVFIGFYNRTAGEFRYINGGHSPVPILLPADTTRETVTLSQAPGMILGVLNDIEIQPASQKLQPGDKLLMVTDGIAEALNNAGRMYGEKRLNSLIRQHRSRPVADLVRELESDLKRFIGDTEQEDDQTILAFEVLAPEG